MKIRSTMLALAIMAGAVATAGAQETTAPKQGQRIERAQRDSTKWGNRQARAARREGRGMRAPRALMRGVNLTDAQKTQIRGIHQKYQAQFKSIRDANKPAIDSARAARQRGDTAAARAAFQKSRGQFESLRQQEMNEVRGVLTPDQQKTFDANLQQMQSRREQHGKRAGRDAK